MALYLNMVFTPIQESFKRHSYEKHMILTTAYAIQPFPPKGPREWMVAIPNVMKTHTWKHAHLPFSPYNLPEALTNTLDVSLSHTFFNADAYTLYSHVILSKIQVAKAHFFPSIAVEFDSLRASGFTISLRQ